MDNNNLEAPSIGNLSLDPVEVKRERIAKATEAKKRKFNGDPLGEYANLAEYEQANGRATGDVVAHFQRRELQEQIARNEAGFARSDARNEGAVAQDHELDTLSGQFNQLDARLTQGTARTLSHVAAAPFTLAGARALSRTDDKAREIFAKEREFNLKNSAIETAKTDLSRSYLKGDLSKEDYARQITALGEAQSLLVPPTEEELAYLDQPAPGDATQRVQGPDGGSVIQVPEAARATFRELFGEALSNQEVAEFLDEAFNENDYVKSLKANSLPREQLQEDVNASFDKEAETIEQAQQKWADGDRSGAVKDALPVVGRLMKESVGNLAENPLATFEFVAENIPQFAAGAVRGGLLITNAGYGANVYQEGIEHYKEQNNGALPTKEEDAQIATAAFAAMAAEQLSDLAVLKGLPLGKVSKPVKDAINQIENNVTRRLTKTAGTAAGTAARTAQGGAGEFIAEGTQTLLEEDVSKLKDVSSLREAYFGATVGMGAGGTVSGATELARGASEVKNHMQENDRLSEEQKAAKKDFETRVTSTVLTGEFESIDTESPHYNNAQHAWALAQHIQRGTTKLDEEGKVARDEEGNAVLEAHTPERRQELTQQLEQLVNTQRQRVEDTADPKERERAEAQLEQMKQFRNSVVEQDTATAEEVQSTVEAAEQGEAVTEEQVERTFGSMRLEPGSISSDQARSLLKIEGLSEPRKQELESYIAVEEGIESLVQTIGERKVRSDVLNGSAGFLGIRDYQDQVNSALRAGDSKKAEKVLQQLNKFVNHQRRKAWVLNKLADRKPLEEKEQAFADQYELSRYKPRTDRGVPHVKRVAAIAQQEAELLLQAKELGKAQIAGMQPSVAPAPKSQTQPQQPTVAETQTAPVSQPDAAAEPQAPAAVETIEATPAAPEVAGETTTERAPTPEAAAAVPESVATQENTRETAPEPAPAAVESDPQADAAPVTEAAPEPGTAETTAAPEPRTSEQLVTQTTNREEPETVPEAEPAKPNFAQQAVKKLRSRADKAATKGLQGFERAKAVFANGWLAKFFKPGSAQHLLQTQDSVFEGYLIPLLTAEHTGKDTDWSAVEALLGNKPNEKQKKALQELVKFYRQFRREIDNNLGLPKEGFTSSMLFAELAEDGRLPENVIAAAAITAFNWLANGGQETAHNDIHSIRSILGIDSRENPHPFAFHLLGNKGIERNALGRNLGREMRKMLGFRPNSNAPVNAQARLEAGLGGLVISTMARMKLLQTQEVNTDLLDMATTLSGRDGAKMAETVVMSELYERADRPAGQKSAKFVRVASVLEGDYFRPADNVQAFKDNAGNSDARRLLEVLFGSKDMVRRPKLTAPKPRNSRMMQKTNQRVPDQANEKMNIHESRKHTLDENMVELMELFSDEELEQIAGLEDPSRVHVSNRAGVEGKNLGKRREIQHLRDFIRELRDSEQGLSTVFYYTHNFWKQMRMGLDSNTVNPQGSKIHRHVVNMEGYENEIDPKNPEDRRDFFVGIAEALGLDIDKPNERTGLQDLQKTLQNAEIQAALTALKKQYTGETFEAADRQAIITAAAKFGGFAGLDALANLARFQEAKEAGTTFTSTIPREVDGVTNGVILGLLQLAAATTSRELARLLRKGGFLFKNDPEQLADYKATGALDTYQEIVPEWQALVDKKPNTAQKAAVGELVGNLQDADGKVLSDGRKRTKQPLMVLFYGSGKRAILAKFVDEVIQLIYDDVQAVVNSNQSPAQKRAAIREINDRISRAVGRQVQAFPENREAMTTLLDRATERALRDAIAKQYGWPLVEAISNKAEAFQRNRTAVNAAMKLMYRMLAVRRETMIEEKREELIAEGRMMRGRADIPASAMREINEALLDTTPGLRSYFADAKELGTHLDLGKSAPVKKVKLANGKTSESNSYLEQELGWKTAEGKTSKKIEHGGGTFSGREFAPSDPGVGPLIMAIHSLDAAIMLNSLAEMPIMNIHDAGITGVKNARRMGEVLNQSTYEVMRNYSIIGESVNSLERALKGFQEWAKGRKLSKDQLEAGKEAREALKDLKVLARESDSKRLEVLDNVRKIQQYNIEGGGFDPHSTGDAGTSVTAEQAGEQQAKETLEGVHEANEPTLGSSGANADIDLDSLRSQPHQVIQKEDLLGVFDRMAGMGTVRENTSHANYLREVVEKLQRRMVRPFKLRELSAGVNENMGALSGDEMFLLYQSFGRTPPVSGMLVNGIRMSMQEVMAHESVHHVFTHMLRTDSVSTRQLRKLWALAKKHVKPEDFLNNPADSSNLDDLAAAQKRWNYIFRPQTDNTDGSSNFLDEFAAFALTNENFRKRLAQIPAQEQRAAINREFFHGRNIQEALVEILQRLMDIVTSSFTKTRGKTIQQAVDNLMFDVLASEGRQKHSILQAYDKAHSIANSVIDPAVNLVKSGVQKAARSSVVRNSRIPGAQTVGGIIRIAGNNTPNALRNVLNQAREDLLGNQYGFFQSLGNEFRGQTESNRWAHDLVRMSNATIDQQRQHVNDIFKQSALEAFVNAPTEEERVALTKVMLKADIASLVGSYDMEALQGMLQDNSVLQTEIRTLLDELRAAGGDFHFYRRGARALGIYMATGHVVESNLMMNADLISTLAGTGQPAPAHAARFRPIIDKLATLYALEHTSNPQKRLVADLIQREEAAAPGNNGISMLLNMHKELKEQSLEILFNNKPQLFMKGYIKEIYNPHIGIKVGTAAEAADLAAKGYKMTDRKLPLDDNDKDREDRYLFVSPTGGLASYMAQAFSLSDIKAKGTTMSTVEYAHVVNDDGDIELVPVDRKDSVMAEKQRAAQEMFRDRTPPYRPGRPPKFAAPLFNEKGQVKEYRYLMTEQVKDDLLEKLNLFDEVIGAMAGSVVDRPASRQFNQGMIRELKSRYDQDRAAGRISDYVEISPTSSDPRLQEIYRMVPKEDREVLRQVWRGNKMMVRKDLVDTLFGYRKATIQHLLEMDERDKTRIHDFVTKAISAVTLGKTHRAVTFERGIRELVSLTKDIIVVRTGLVTLGNTVSNIMYLRGNGISMSRGLIDMTKALHGAINYQKDRNERDKLKLKLRTGQDASKHDEYRERIVILEDQLAKNPVTPLMKEGVMQAIVEDVNLDQDRFSYKNKLAEKVEKFTDRVPAPIRAVWNLATVGQDTQLYKVLNNAVRLSDFTARYALYQDQLRRGVSHGEAVSYVVEKFVNFDIPTHKLIQYANDHGLIWFSKYGIRIQKVIYEMFRDNPTEAIKLLLLENLVGEIDDIGDALWGFQANPADKIGTPARILDAYGEIAPLNLIM